MNQHETCSVPDTMSSAEYTYLSPTGYRKKNSKKKLIMLTSIFQVYNVKIITYKLHTFLDIF